MISVMLGVPRRGADYTPVWRLVDSVAGGFVRLLKIAFLLLIVKFIVVKIGWGGLALCVIFLPAVFIAGLFIFAFIDSKINGYKFW